MTVPSLVPDQVAIGAVASEVAARHAADGDYTAAVSSALYSSTSVLQSVAQSTENRLSLGESSISASSVIVSLASDLSSVSVRECQPFAVGIRSKLSGLEVHVELARMR